MMQRNAKILKTGVYIQEMEMTSHGKKKKNEREDLQTIMRKQ